MSKLFTFRPWFFFVALACGALLGYALWVQHVDFLDPCPLCILQRVGFLWMGVFALVAVIHGPGRAGRIAYGILVAVGAAFGGAVAARHVWLQNLPADQVPACGPGLNYLVEQEGVMSALESVLFASGSCAEIDWVFLGITMPGWTLIWFIGLGLISLWVAFRRERGVEIVR